MYAIRSVRPRLPVRHLSRARSQRGRGTADHVPADPGQQTEFEPGLHPRRHLRPENDVHPYPGSRPWSGKRNKPASATARDIVKRSVVTIKNRDALCCACAIVTMRAWADEKARVFPPVGYKTLKNWSTGSGTVGQRTPSIGGRTRRSLRHPRTDAVSSRVTRLPD